MNTTTQRKSTYAIKKEGVPVHGVADLIEGYYEFGKTHTDAFGVEITEWQPVRIWFGPPFDPETGDELDRSPRWQAIRDGLETDPYRIWTHVCHRPISVEKYCQLLKETEYE